MRSEVTAGAPLEYLTLYPDGYDDEASYPLLVWLHGFGAAMRDLAGLARAVGRSGHLHVLPNAPPGGFGAPEGTVRAWFERGGKERPESVRLALAALDTFLDEILARFRVRPGRALLAGFSQGGNLALRAGLPRPDVFKGIAALSCSLRRADDLSADLPAARDQAIFLAHGVEDELVPVECSRGVAALLRERGYRPLYQEHPLGHEISKPLAVALADWIGVVLPPRSG